MNRDDEHPGIIRLPMTPELEQAKLEFVEHLKRLGSDGVITLPREVEPTDFVLLVEPSADQREYSALAGLARARFLEDWQRQQERFGMAGIVRLYDQRSTRYWGRRMEYHRRKANRAARAASRRKGR